MNVVYSMSEPNEKGGDNEGRFAMGKLNKHLWR